MMKNSHSLKTEWLYQYPALSQSCNMQTNNMTVVPTSSVGLQMPPTFLETSATWDFTELFPNNNSDGYLMRNTDDGLVYVHGDNAICPSSTQGNAVDPNVYLRLSPDPLQSRNSNASPHSEVDGLSDTGSPVFHHCPASELDAALQPACPIPNNRNSKVMSPDLARQASLNVVMEVLGTCPVNDDQPNIDLGFYSPDSSSTYNEDDQYLQHPSPSYVQFSTPMSTPSRNRTYSDLLPSFSESTEVDSSRLRAFSADAGYPLTINVSDKHLPFANYALSTVSTQESEAASSESNSAATDAPGSVSSATETTISSVEASSETTSDLIVHPSMEDRENPLDAMKILEDLMGSSNPNVQKTPAVQHPENVALATINAEHDYSSSQEAVAFEILADLGPATSLLPITPPTTTTLVDLTEESICASTLDVSSVAKLERTPSYRRKRSQNNKACRESRKKRKTQRDEAEIKVIELTKDNQLTRKKIAELEVEVRQTRARLIAQMTGVNP